MSDVRIAVIGAGVMGGNHARVARNVAGGHLTAVVDQDLGRASALVAGSAAKAVGDIGEVIDDFDLAIVAVPTSGHHDLVLALLDAGKHVLVEKPIAASTEQAQAMIDRASTRGGILAVGHIERFNAAVRELPGLMESPIHIRATRVSPYSPIFFFEFFFFFFQNLHEIYANLPKSEHRSIETINDRHAKSDIMLAKYLIKNIKLNKNLTSSVGLISVPLPAKLVATKIVFGAISSLICAFSSSSSLLAYVLIFACVF